MIATPLQIAIDGPVAAGKGDIAARLAKEFHLLYINTGAMYRMLALACIQKGISTKNKDGIINVLKNTVMDLLPPSLSNKDKTFIAMLNGHDVTDRILLPDTASGSSDVAIIPEVRKKMVVLQQKLAEGKSVVMEGRDIGLRVLPNAQLKIYLTASVEERAKRRWLQWKAKGIKKTIEETLEETIQRDAQDMKRTTDPLQKLPDAWELDTTGMTQNEVVNKIRLKLQSLKLL